MHGGDRGHEREAPRGPAPQRVAHEGDPLPDGGPVPPGAILIGEQHQVAVIAEPGRPPGVGEEDEGQQAGDVRVVGQQGAQHPGQVEGPLHEVAPDQIGASRRGVPGRVEEVDDGEHGVDARGEFRRRAAPGYGMRAMAIFFLARVMRAAIVASLTRNARATSAVVSPQSRRSVSATWASVPMAG